MSADNWAVCPRCKRDSSDPEFSESEFREDYEQGVLPSGEYYVSYRGHCKSCGLTHTFKHTQRVSF